MINGLPIRQPNLGQTGFGVAYIGPALNVFHSGSKDQPKEEVFGMDIPRTSGGHSRGCPGPKLRSLIVLDGRNCARLIAESLAIVIAVIRITSVRWRSYLLPKTQKLALIDPAFVALRFASRDWRSLV